MNKNNQAVHLKVANFAVIVAAASRL